MRLTAYVNCVRCVEFVHLITSWQVFRVRRVFSWKNKYLYTLIDLKSTLLQEVLQEVLKNVKGLSLTEETPEVRFDFFRIYEFRTLT